jgi:hydrogenase maturation factor HypE
LLPRKQVSTLQHSSTVLDCFLRLAWDRSLVLLPILAGSTFRRGGELAAGSVKSSVGFRAAKDATSHKKLDLAESNVAKSMVPTK